MLLRVAILFFGISALTGIALVGAADNDVGPLSMIAWLHVVLSWVSLPVLVVFVARHSYARWSTTVSSRRLEGVLGATCLVLLLASGVAIGDASYGVPARAAARTHAWTTWLFLFFLVRHLWGVWPRRRRARY